MLKVLGIAVLVLLLGGTLIYRSSASAQYLVMTALDRNKIKNISFELCLNSSDKNCVSETLRRHEMYNANEMMIVLSKLVGFFATNSNSGGEAELQTINRAINELLSQVRLKNHQLLRVNPLFSFSAKGLCQMQTIEKMNTGKVLTKLSVQCDKDRQIAFETYPHNKELQYVFVRRKELLNQLLADLDNVFPSENLNKCKKSYK